MLTAGWLAIHLRARHKAGGAVVAHRLRRRSCPPRRAAWTASNIGAVTVASSTATRRRYDRCCGPGKRASPGRRTAPAGLAGADPAGAGEQAHLIGARRRPRFDVVEQRPVAHAGRSGSSNDRDR